MLLLSLSFPGQLAFGCTKDCLPHQEISLLWVHSIPLSRHLIRFGCSLQFFLTFSAEAVCDGENVDGDDVDLCDIFDDPAVKKQLLQNDLECECELEQQSG